MLYSDYVASTMIVSLAKILPLIISAAVGYFLFVKLPFYVFLKVLRSSKGLDFQVQDFKSSFAQDFKPDYSVKNYEAFLRRRQRARETDAPSPDNVLEFRQKVESGQNEEVKKQAREERAQQRAEQEERLKQQRAEYQRKQQEKREKEAKERAEKARQERMKRETYSSTSAEEIFNLKPGDNFSQSELKKKYRELLKANHPDKFAADRTEVRNLAEKKTKEINSAFDKLKGRAA